MSDSSDEDTRAKPHMKGGPKFPDYPAPPEESTELDKDDEGYDDEEEQGLKAPDFTLSKPAAAIVVSVGNPMLRDGGMLSGKFTDYEVSGQDKIGSFSVRRRYKEFAELRNKLTANWPGYFIPPIPEKKATGNTDAEFVKQRQHALHHFMERCGKMGHIFYAPEMQLFLRTTDNVVKVLSAAKTLTHTSMYERNREQFPEYAKEMTEKVQKSVKKYFQTLEATIKFFSKFRAVAKNMMVVRPKLKANKTQFMKYAINDYKNKLKSSEAKKEIEDKFKEYQKLEREDDLTTFLRRLKDLELDLTSFMSIRGDLENLGRTVDRIKKQQEEANKNLAKTRSLAGEEVKEGLFKKISKTERIAQLEKEIEDVISE